MITFSLVCHQCNNRELVTVTSVGTDQTKGKTTDLIISNGPIDPFGDQYFFCLKPDLVDIFIHILQNAHFLWTFFRGCESDTRFKILYDIVCICMSNRHGAPKGIYSFFFFFFLLHVSLFFEITFFGVRSCLQLQTFVFLPSPCGSTRLLWSLDPSHVSRRCSFRGDELGLVCGRGRSGAGSLSAVSSQVEEELCVSGGQKFDIKLNDWLKIW